MNKTLDRRTFLFLESIYVTLIMFGLYMNFSKVNRSFMMRIKNFRKTIG